LIFDANCEFILYVGKLKRDHSIFVIYNCRLKKISTLTVKEDGMQAYVGTEGGNIYTLDINKFEIGDKIIYLDVVLQK